MVQLNQKFINSIAQEMPPHLSMDDFVHYCGLPLRLSIRVNTLKITSDALRAILEPRGWQFEPVPWCEDGFWVTVPDDCQPGNLTEHYQGLFYIQEASSMMPPCALFMDKEPRQLLLDVASAPGSKTTQLAALMHNQGLIIANEYSASRTKALHANLQRMGVANVAITQFDGRVFGAHLYETLDAIQLDAPCSGEGTVRKDPLSLKNWCPDEIEAIAELQRDLIDSAFQALKPGGVLVYSTCTLNRRENEDVCHFLKERYGDAVVFESLNDLFKGADKALTEEGFLHIWPQIYDSEGFFVARIRKTASVARNTDDPRFVSKFPFVAANRKELSALEEAMLALGVSLPEDAVIVTRDGEFWLMPAPLDGLLTKMRFQRIGIRLAETQKHGIKVRHEAVMALPCNQMLSIEPEAAKQYLMGRDIALDNAGKAQGEKILSLHGAPLGIAKHLGNKLKNSLPRDLCRDNVQN
ncbi:16S rRNA (cytosine(1407)-C(5))-methyltransferase RsmF [Shewanella amazonensis]|uniref:Ribosomal RNA small subunit methyltransferase F n=1 Tax=Shewanella amazonensis (strain ATCC BAA-1098 / SB2B) TaxID=326297 RepID=RSMF_SHEAM|nr:16S rRNA (cytosine(1407)-C(5))-methyltransferase RsmF [Shewanella amazonensis]A1S788.1 RecName: Full=Ribosomal RNA small subunit methyltransferase F; AltName: Full=16S rRNA m5C1407 methyltransferase; AltName: Full=rRNA (cytosine-C(5)-)-methyltransferase RsmF [Shewanella amazonensis SB2B]ABM00245.1 NOL1/NOP2/sun family protein [Shewanella amazonensis SB2B]